MLFKGKLIQKEDKMATGYGYSILKSQLHILADTTHFTGIMLHFVCQLWLPSGKKDYDIVMMLLKNIGPNFILMQIL